MTERTIAAIGSAAGAAALVVLGALHIALGLPSLQRAVERGTLTPQLAGPQMVNWVFSGGAMCLLGALLGTWVPDLLRGRRSAWRSALITGLFFVLVGAGAYLWVPRAAVLVFSAVGICVVVPLVFGARCFNEA